MQDGVEKAVAVVDDVGQVSEGVARNSTFPLALIAVIVAFLVVQHRIDLRDPKLAQSPVITDPHLRFLPPFPAMGLGED